MRPWTEGQAELLHQRLEAHGASPRRIKDAVMALGGKGFVLFARSQPDTPGKLAAHAHSFEALEMASYEMLIRMAHLAGDTATAATARRIRDQDPGSRRELKVALRVGAMSRTEPASTAGGAPSTPWPSMAAPPGT